MVRGDEVTHEEGELTMHWDNLSDSMLDLLPPRMVVLPVGLRKGSFIGRTAWVPNIRRVPELEFKYACPSRDAAAAYRFCLTAYLDPGNVSHNFDGLLDMALKREGADNLIVCISVETAGHADLIERSIGAGVKFILCDKPVVARIEQFRKIAPPTRDKAVEVLISMNHRFCAGVHLLQHEVAAAVARGEGVHIAPFFWQRWLLDDTESQQAQARLCDLWCTLLDLSVHISDIGSFIAGSPLVAVENAKVRRGLTGKYADVITGGSCTYVFENPHVTGDGDCDQCKDGPFMDDIGVLVTFGNRRLLWRMKECGGDSVLVGKAKARLNCRGDWKQLERGAEGFDAGIASLFPKNPPGHGSSDWDLMWWYWMYSCMGRIWTKRGLPIAGHLEPHMQLRVPTLFDAGLETTRYMHAHVQSAESSGARVDLASIPGWPA